MWRIYGQDCYCPADDNRVCADHTLPFDHRPKHRITCLLKKGGQGTGVIRGKGTHVKRLLSFRKIQILLTVGGLCSVLVSAWVDLSSPYDGNDPMERRQERLQVFRAKRDQFFKEDPRSPLKEADRKKFKGLLYYPINLQYAMTGSIERYPTEPKPTYVNLPTNKEREKKYVKYGRFKFRWEGKEYVLQIYRPLGGGELFLPFKDKNSGNETYPDGRYLYIETISEGSESTRTEKVLIDFNRAHNPFCAYNEKYTCSFAPKENWLEIPIQAGEKRYK